MNSPLVKVTIVSEQQAQQTQQTNKCSEHTCGEILNSTGNMEVDLIYYLYDFKYI